MVLASKSFDKVLLEKNRMLQAQNVTQLLTVTAIVHYPECYPNELKNKQSRLSKSKQMQLTQRTLPLTKTQYPVASTGANKWKKSAS